MQHIRADRLTKSDVREYVFDNAFEKKQFVVRRAFLEGLDEIFDLLRVRFAIRASQYANDLQDAP